MAGTKFNTPSAKRIARVVRRVERIPINRAASQVFPPIIRSRNKTATYQIIHPPRLCEFTQDGSGRGYYTAAVLASKVSAEQDDFGLGSVRTAFTFYNMLAYINSFGVLDQATGYFNRAQIDVLRNDPGVESNLGNVHLLIAKFAQGYCATGSLVSGSSVSQQEGFDGEITSGGLSGPLVATLSGALAGSSYARAAINIVRMVDGGTDSGLGASFTLTDEIYVRDALSTPAASLAVTSGSSVLCSYNAPLAGGGQNPQNMSVFWIQNSTYGYLPVFNFNNALCA